MRRRKAGRQILSFSMALLLAVGLLPVNTTAVRAEEQTAAESTVEESESQETDTAQEPETESSAGEELTEIEESVTAKEAEAVTEAETESETETETESETETETESETETETETETESETETETELETETETETETDEEAELMLMALDEDENLATEKIDLSSGLSASKTYGDQDVVSITVLEDMNAKSDSANTTYSTYVTGSNNPKPAKGEVPTSGAALKMEAAADCSVTIVSRQSTGKKLYVLEVASDGTVTKLIDGVTDEADKDSDGAYIYRTDNFDLTKGNTYYFYRDGSKVSIAAISYTYEKEEETETKTDVTLPKVLAFEGAEGGGRYATGGRGGDVYVVTSLEDYGSDESAKEGTLRYGVETAPDEGRIIVFNVGGTIHLKQTLGFSGKQNITIAGQTAPGDGITLAGYDTNISDSENIIIRFVRFRVGTENLLQGGDSMDALWGRDNDTFIIDHCSFSWNTDETLSTYRGKNGTVQWCIISESLTVSGHSKGRHGYGGIWGGDNTVFQYNLIADHTSRNPRIGGGSMTDPTASESYATLQISNNVLYNWGYYACYGGGYTWTNYLNNYLKAGKGTRDSVVNSIIDFGENNKVGGVYVSGNYLEGNEEYSNDNSKGTTSTGSTTTIADKAYTSEAFENITLVSAQDCYDDVLAQAGATFPRRDAIDARVVAQVETDTGAYINTQDEVGGYCTASSEREADFDTDCDGIPDEWETAHGLDPQDATDSAKLDESGYAYVELYFNELVEEVVAEDYEAENPDVTIDLENNTLLDEGSSVTVTATATANNGGSISKVEFYNGSELVATVTEAPYAYTYSGLADGTYYISVRAYDDDGNATQSNTSYLHVNSTAGTGEWGSTDIGTPGVKGTASLEDGVLTVKSAGKIGKSEGSVEGTDYADATTDDFHYVYTKADSSMELVTKLDSYTAVDNHTFNGIMFRDSLEDDAMTVGLGLSMVKINETSVWSVYMLNRSETGGDISEISETIDSASAAAEAGIPIVTNLNFKSGNTFNGIWLKLSREGSEFTGYVSEDGVTWQKVGTLTVAMSDEAYVGFAVDANKVANDLENYATAKFSNIKINDSFVKISYDITNLESAGAERLAVGENLSVTLSKTKGYILPQSVEVTMDGAAVDYTYDPETGTIYVENVTGDVTIKAAGVLREIKKVTYEIVDENNLLTVTEEDNKLILEQSATTGRVAKNITTPAENESYLLFPAVNEYHTLSLKIKVTNLIETDNPKETGIFVGVHDVSGNAYTTLSFRACGAESLCGYWTKSAVKSGNGSPKLEVALDTVYDVTFQTNGSGGYLVTFVSEDGVVDSKREFKANDIYMKTGDTVQYGIGIIGASCEITDMVLTDHEGNVIYDQNAKEEETAPDTNADSSQQTESTQSSAASQSTGSTETVQPQEPDVQEQYTENNEPYANIVFHEKNTLLRLDLLQKYYGRNMYLMAHLGNGVGFSISSEDASKQQDDLQLGYRKSDLPDFAEGFSSLLLKPTAETTLSYQVGLHVNVGTEYIGHQAYIFVKSTLTGQYELEKVQAVNEIGNVGLFTDTLTDVMILIEK